MWRSGGSWARSTVRVQWHSGDGCTQHDLVGLLQRKMVRRLDEIGAGQVIDDFAVDERRADVVAPDSAGVDQPLGAVRYAFFLASLLLHHLFQGDSLFALS